MAYKRMIEKSRVKLLVQGFVWLLFLVSGSAFAQKGIQTGIALIEQRKFYEAVEFFEKSRLSFEQHADSHYYYGIGLLKIGQSEQAVNSFQLADELLPNNSDFNFALAKAYSIYIDEVSFLRKLDVSKKMFSSVEKAVTLNPENLNAQIFYITLLVQVPGIAGGNIEKGKELAKELANIDESHAYYAEALIADEEERSDDAVRYYEAALESNAALSGAVYSFGSYLTGQGLLRRALEHFNEYPTRELHWSDPDIYGAYGYIGWIQNNIGDKENARTSYQTSLEHVHTETARVRMQTALDGI